MEPLFIIYSVAAILTLPLYFTIKHYSEAKHLKHFRSQLKPGQSVTVKAYGIYHQAEIINIHDELCFCWIAESEIYSYVEPLNIFPYDY